MSHILVPIFICVVLPVAIMSIICYVAINHDNKRAQIIIKAIEANNGIDTDKLAKALSKQNKTAREILNLRLLRGCIFTLISLSLYAAGVLGRINGMGYGHIAVYIPVILGCASLAVGISYLIVYFVTRKQGTDNHGINE